MSLELKLSKINDKEKRKNAKVYLGYLVNEHKSEEIFFKRLNNVNIKLMSEKIPKRYYSDGDKVYEVIVNNPKLTEVAKIYKR